MFLIKKKWVEYILYFMHNLEIIFNSSSFVETSYLHFEHDDYCMSVLVL